MRSSRLVFCFVFALVGLSQKVRCAAPDRYALRGDILTADSVIPDGVIVIRGREIESVGTAVPVAMPVLATGGLICPGFVDLHNHLTWNVFPRWKSGRKFPNRYEWQQYPEYLMALAGPHATLIERGDGPAMARYCEVKAIAGGATSLAGLYPGDLGPRFKPPYRGMMRMLDIGSGLHPDGVAEGVRYNVFPFFIEEAEAGEIRAGLKDHSIASLLVHLGEGSSQDASSINEFQMLKARGLLLPGVTLIHGVSLHSAQFAEMARLAVGLVWSPRSNFELYGMTADVAEAKKAGVRIALAPDWSPTGSDGMIEELKYAAVWNAMRDTPLFTDRELVRMATSVPASLAGVQARIGTLAPGMMADLLVIRKGTGDAYHSLVHSGPADIEFAVVGGRPVYGKKAWAMDVAPDVSWTPLTVATVGRVVSLPADPALGDWSDLCAHLDAELREVGSHLGPIAGDESADK